MTGKVNAQRNKHTSVNRTLVGKIKEIKIFILIEKNTDETEKKHRVFSNRITHLSDRKYTTSLVLNICMNLKN